MTEVEIGRTLDEAYAHADKAYEAVNGSALESRSTALAELAQKLRSARDAVGQFDIDHLSNQSA